MAINDKKHRKLMSRYIEKVEQQVKQLSDIWAKTYPNIPLELKIEIEKPYNHYGSRGFIDILYSLGMVTGICEVKPVLSNLGEALRQLRRAHDAIMNNAVTDFKINNTIMLYLVSNLTKENVDIIRNAYPILKNVDSLFIELYCEHEDNFIGTFSGAMKDSFIEKYGDTLLKQWEASKS